MEQSFFRPATRTVPNMQSSYIIAHHHITPLMRIQTPAQPMGDARNGDSFIYSAASNPRIGTANAKMKAPLLRIGNYLR